MLENHELISIEEVTEQGVKQGRFRGIFWI